MGHRSQRPENSRAGTSSRWAGPDSPARRSSGPRVAEEASRAGARPSCTLQPRRTRRGPQIAHQPVQREVQGRIQGHLPRGQFRYGRAPEQAQDPVSGWWRGARHNPGRRHLDRRAGRERLDLRPLRPLPGEPTAGVPARLRRGHNLQWQALRHAVVHGYGTPLLSQGPARKERLRQSSEDLERAQADDQEGACESRTSSSGSSSRVRGTRAGCATPASSSGATAATSSTPSDPTRVVIDSPQAIAGLETERSMITDGISPEAVTVYEEAESEGPFLNGDAVFLRNWPYVYALIGTSDYPKLKPEQVGVSELPSADGKPGNGTVGDQPLYISASSKYPDAAWKFIRVRHRVRAAEIQGARRLVPADHLGSLRRPRDPGHRARRRPRQRGAPAHPPAPRIALLLGHVPRDAGAVQRFAQG